MQLSADLQRLQAHQCVLQRSRENRAVFEDCQRFLQAEARLTGGRRHQGSASSRSLLGRAGQARRLPLPGRQQDSLYLVDRPQRETQKKRLGRPAECELPDPALDMPFGMRAVLEEDDVARTVAGGTHGVVFKNYRALEDQDRLVEIIIPVEFALAALPDDGGGEPILAS